VTITKAQFDSLLGWLNPDRDIAGKKYKTIHSGLVRIFVGKGLNNAEDLADETINRVMLRLSNIQESYRGEPAYYFHRVAKNIIRECRRRKEFPVATVDVSVPPKLDAGEEHNCLKHCLNCLSDSKRDLILDYYLYEGHSKIEHHRLMAGELKTTIGAIRNRAFQIRHALQNCMQKCALREGPQPRLSRSRSNNS
jgi:RNA polymerase sigma factor (sigma-70 family)